jgi:kynurenine formamidase
MRLSLRAGALLLACAAIAVCGPRDGDLTSATIVDLSHAYGADTIFWPTDTEGFVLEEIAAGLTEQGYYYSANRFRAAEHGGTHLDAPVHFAEGHISVDEIPLERLIGEGIVVDVSSACAADPDYRIAVSDLQAWEAVNGRIADGSILLLRTGYGEHWGSRARYLGTDALGPEAVTLLHFPGLDPDAARWLTEERAIKAIGLDTASIDAGQSSLFESHQILSARDVPIFENLARLNELPSGGFSVVALPMKIRGGSGAPLRAIALVP